MSETQHHLQPRALAPRRLEQSETLQTLNQWRGVLLNYFRRCQYNSYFLRSGLTWDTSVNHGFVAPETTGLKRSAAVLAEDLDGLFDSIASYLPFDYIADKLKTETTCMTDVWNIIYEVYDAEVSTTHYLDYATMSRNPQETYRNYYNRLVGFVRQHLPKSAITAEGVTSPRAGEVMSIALLDSIAIHWLLSIDRQLINIVKTEFSSQLKTKRLSQMIKPIATNIDELLARYGNRDTVSPIHINDTESPRTVHSTARPDSQSVDMLVSRIQKLEHKVKYNNFPNKYRSSNSSRDFKKEKNYCIHCSILNKQLGANLNTNHDSQSCSRKKVSISVIESIGENNSPTDNTSDTDEGDKISMMPSSNRLLQIDNSVADSPVPNNQSCENSSNTNTVNEPLAHNLKLNNNSGVNNIISDKTQKLSSSDAVNMYPSSLIPAILALQSSTIAWDSIHKAKSPKISCTFNNIKFPLLIDSGAEINVMDEDFVIKAGIGMLEASELAQAANRLPLEIIGQTSHPVTISCDTEEGSKPINLGIVLVVRKLGIPCLLGEPGKLNNNIICLPQRKIVILAGNQDVHHAPYLTDKDRYNLARVSKTVTLQPGEQLLYSLPSNLCSISHVAVTPRLAALAWLKPAIHETTKGSIYLTNSSSEPVKLSKSDHIADIRDTSIFSLETKPSPS